MLLYFVNSDSSYEKAPNMDMIMALSRVGHVISLLYKVWYTCSGEIWKIKQYCIGIYQTKSLVHENKLKMLFNNIIRLM